MNLGDFTDQEVQQITFTPEISDKSAEIANLWDSELFNDPTLKNWLNKIFEKEAESILTTFEKNNYEKNGWLAIESRWRLIETKHPDMIPFVYWELWLPYKKDIYLHPEQWTKFSELTFDQKMWFMCLKRTFDFYKGSIDNISSEEFINKYKQIYSWTMDVVLDHFVDTIKRESIEVPTGFDFSEFKVEWDYYIKLNKFLKDNYWLTNDEISKFKDLAEICKDHPEYLETQMAAGKIPRKEILSLLKWVIIGCIFIFWFKYVWDLIKSFKEKPTETRVYWDHTEILDFEKVMKIVPLQAETYSDRRTISEDWLWTFDEESGWWFVRNMKKWANEVIERINKAQHRDLDLEVSTEIAYFFDETSATCSVDRKDWVVYFHIMVKRPEVKIIGEEVKFYNSKRERVNVDKFDDFDKKAIDILKQEAIDEASKPENIEKSKEALEEYFLNHFKTFWMANSDMIVHAEEPMKVEVEYLIETENNPDNIHFAK